MKNVRKEATRFLYRVMMDERASIEARIHAADALLRHGAIQTLAYEVQQGLEAVGKGVRR